MAQQSPSSSSSTRCLCATVKRAARLLTRRYEEALRPAGVTTSQFELMQTLRAAGPGDQSTLARLLETDQTTLSRNLRLLLTERWLIAAVDPRDARRQVYRLTPLGLTVLAEAQRCWNLVHADMQRRLGHTLPAVWPMLDRILDAARAQPDAL